MTITPQEHTKDMRDNSTPTWKILRKLLANTNPVTVSVYRSIVLHRRVDLFAMPESTRGK